MYTAVFAIIETIMYQNTCSVVFHVLYFIPPQLILNYTRAAIKRNRVIEDGHS